MTTGYVRVVEVPEETVEVRSRLRRDVVEVDGVSDYVQHCRTQLVIAPIFLSKCVYLLDSVYVYSQIYHQQYIQGVHV